MKKENVSMSDNERIRNLQNQLRNMLRFYNLFKIMSDSYIIEFFTNNHWETLPEKWRHALDGLKPTEVARLLLQHENPDNGYPKVWPLSLLAFKKTSEVLTNLRNHHNLKYTGVVLQNKNLDSVFRRHVNPKKQHEISILSGVISKSFSKGKCTRVIDIGSGQGHLSRVLALQHTLPVSAVDNVQSHIKAAEKYDKEATKQLSKAKKQHKNTLIPPQHYVHSLPCIGCPQETMKKLKTDIYNANGNEYQEKERYLLTGLHACGDLSATMVKMFVECEEVTSVVSVACCYMKITTDFEVSHCGVGGKDTYRYPLSDFLKSISGHELPYKSREASCHAIEDYKLRLKENTDHLKMHCYRAALETLIRETHPNLIRPGVQTVKKAYTLPFSQYVELAFNKLNLNHPEIHSPVSVSHIESMLSRWHQVVTYYTLTIMVAQVVEMIILLDRVLYVEENGFECELDAIFEPTLSPRCFSITAHK
uniref:protein RRNAD1-like n=1 Tax=Ciona intestinalis TaxID=7719 RepID=UPI00006A6039|nr:protein RRNAD1-like [Ciona intestinalis]|eukprot:XP_002130567.1 protein RRNAD1-like [Ciona intestinalis]